MNTIQFQRESLENAATNAEVLQVMGSAAKAMKSAHKGLEVDQVCLWLLRNTGSNYSQKFEFFSKSSIFTQNSNFS